MDIYKRGIKQKLRFKTLVGLLSIEQLMDLTLDQLDQLAVELEDKSTKSDRKSFLKVATVQEAEHKLRFDIVFDILDTKIKAHEVAAKAAETRAQKQKIHALIADKKDEALKGKSLAELEALLA